MGLRHHSGRASVHRIADGCLGAMVEPPSTPLTEMATWAKPTVIIAAGAPGDTYLATGLFGIAAAAIIAGAGLLVYSAVSGKNGLAAFMGKEKDENPFYKDDFQKYAPRGPDILNKIRLPDLDFVDVYNQPAPLQQRDEEDEEGVNIDAVIAAAGGAGSDVVATADTMRQKLLQAVEAKDYATASKLEKELVSFMRRNGMSFEDDKT